MIHNQLLFQKKIESLDHSSQNIKDTKFTLTCLYHGVPLTFHTNNEIFYNELKNYLPTSWLSSSSGVNIFICPITDYHFDNESWANELSQDCYVQNKHIIQRDFAAKIVNTNTISLITVEEICDGLFNFLRWYLPLELMKVDKLILHSSCILDKDANAHFFLGHSGAGKTTITELSSPRIILGDDMNLLSHKDDKMVAQAGAIGGLFKPQVNYDDQFPIKSFNWIIQSPQNKRVKLNISQARTKLMASVSNIFWDALSESQTQYIFNSVLKSLERTPMYELHFKKDSSFWGLIE